MVLCIDGPVIFMDDMIMQYYEGLRFRQHHERAGCKAWCQKKFDYFVLDYAHSGELMELTRRQIEQFEARFGLSNGRGQFA